MLLKILWLVKTRIFETLFVWKFIILRQYYCSYEQDIEKAKEVDFNFINYFITKKYLLFRRAFHYVKFSDA